jgi:succinyl-diaminopimelate desuccinylase
MPRSGRDYAPRVADEGAVGARLAEATLTLVDVRSVSRAEREIAEVVARAMPWEPTWRDGETLWYREAGEGPLVVLAGHLDTVPPQGNLPGWIANGAVHGLGASDMKGGLAVMAELARARAAKPAAPGLRFGYLFFPREEVSVVESPLPTFFGTGALDEAALVVVLEPTDNEIHAGCLGNLVARLEWTGESAHSARPWTGVNAVGLAVEGLTPLVRREPVEVEAGGLVFREVVTVTRIEGGVADNVVPAAATATVNVRFAPGRSVDDAVASLAELAAPTGASVTVVAASPSAPVATENPLAERLRAVGDLAVAPKQAWTPVAQFAERGLDAVNFGPGATAYAHRRDERVEIAELVRAYEVLSRFADTV